ncbi:hypothetical protein [Dickeya ananatis]
MFKLIPLLLNAERATKRIVTVFYDVVAIVASLYLAVAVRLGTTDFPIGSAEIASVVVTLSITILVFIRCGMYRAVLRYMMLPAMGYVFLSVILSAVSLALSSFFFSIFCSTQRTVYLRGSGDSRFGQPSRTHPNLLLPLL